MFNHMKISNNSIDCLRHRVLFAEEVQGQLLDVIDGFLRSPDGHVLKLEDATDGALLGFSDASFTIATSAPVPTDVGTLDNKHIVPCDYKLYTAISPDGAYSLNFTHHWNIHGERKSEGYEHSGRFDPFHDDISEVASAIMLDYMKEHSDNYISGMLTEHLIARIGKERPQMGWEPPRQEV